MSVKKETNIHNKYRKQQKIEKELKDKRKLPQNRKKIEISYTKK